MTAPLPAAVFASGGGSNLQSLLDHSESTEAPWRISVVIANRDAGVLMRARAAGIPTAVIPTKDRDPQDVGEETLSVLGTHAVDLVFLAGYLRLLPPAVISAFRNRILNVHPALLPAFGGKGMYGMHVHEAVLASGARVSGPTVHLVDEEYDRGRILAQLPVPVLLGDTAEELAARVLAAEHRLFSIVADHVARAVLEGREPEPLDARHWEDISHASNQDQSTRKDGI